MGFFKEVPKWREISKRKFEKEKQAYIEKYGDQGELFFSYNHKIEPILERKGLLNMIRDDNPIIGYKYYRLVRMDRVYFCGSEEYEFWRKKRI